MTFWIKTDEGRAVKLVDENWRARIYAAGEACDDADYVFSKVKDFGLVNSIRVVKKREVENRRKHPVLEIELKQARRAKQVADLLESKFQDPARFRLYNVDVLPEQSYFYENDLFPLARVKAYVDGNRVTRWKPEDSIESFDYKIPPLRLMSLSVKTADRVPKLGSKLEKIGITTSKIQDEPDFEESFFDGGEREMLERIASEVKSFDPDILITQNGDSFVLPYLYSKARAYSVDLGLDRDQVEQEVSSKSGTTYFSYGRVMFRPHTQRLYGRLHLDEENTFVYDQCRLQGLFEVSRLCRMPLHTSARASIGKCLSGLQFYYASKREILIPWKPNIAEDFKNGYDLIVGDRGGLVLSPLEGIHEHVCEIDFSSLYPSIIRKWNISAETVNCDCCKDSSAGIEELGLRICTKHNGIVADSLSLPLDRRFEYKNLMEKSRGTQAWKNYNERAAALKWILVCCLAGESPILIKRGGRVEYVKIGEFIDSIVGEREGIIDCPAGISVAGVGHDLKSTFSKVSKLLKVPNHQKLLSIAMDGGRKIIATPDHPFYLLKNGNLEVRQASDLKEGNFIPVAKKMPSPERSEEFIDVTYQLLNSLDDAELERWRVSGQILSQFLLENKQIVLEASMKHGYSNKAVRVWIKMGMMPLRFFNLLNVPLDMRKFLRVGIGRTKGKFGRTSWMPAVIPINEEFGFFLGLDSCYHLLLASLP